MDKKILTTTYIQEGFTAPENIRLSDEEYARALQSLVVATVDIVAIDKKKKFFYLPSRKCKPVTGNWFFGGRIFPGETGEAGAARCLHRETGLTVDLGRFTLAAHADYMFKDRQQEPQTMGCHTRSRIFSVELTPKEIEFAAAHLDPNEYDSNFGLKPFTCDDLVKANAYPIIIELHRSIFS